MGGRPLLVLALAWGAVSDAPAQPPDSNLGRDLAAACASCHGTKGEGQKDMPSLAGLDRSEMAQKLRDFRTGKRAATVMGQISKGYSDDQIDAIAAYLSARTR
ncbi:MAG TPA: c-type cytochrome [Burkholderiales bacterium]|nr:c-type cytochrome [Burkholderiales bacterium]